MVSGKAEMFGQAFTVGFLTMKVFGRLLIGGVCRLLPQKDDGRSLHSGSQTILEPRMMHLVGLVLVLGFFQGLAKGRCVLVTIYLG